MKISAVTFGRCAIWRKVCSTICKSMRNLARDAVHRDRWSVVDRGINFGTKSEMLFRLASQHRWSKIYTPYIYNISATFNSFPLIVLSVLIVSKIALLRSVQVQRNHLATVVAASICPNYRSLRKYSLKFKPVYACRLFPPHMIPYTVYSVFNHS